MEKNSRENAIQNAIFFPKQCVISFFSQHHATEIPNDLLCDHRWVPEQAEPPAAGKTQKLQF